MVSSYSSYFPVFCYRCTKLPNRRKLPVLLFGKGRRLPPRDCCLVPPFWTALELFLKLSMYHVLITRWSIFQTENVQSANHLVVSRRRLCEEHVIHVSFSAWGHEGPAKLCVFRNRFTRIYNLRVLWVLIFAYSLVSRIM